jgi:hypothetical protein
MRISEKIIIYFVQVRKCANWLSIKKKLPYRLLAGRNICTEIKLEVVDLIVSPPVPEFHDFFVLHGLLHHPQQK